MVTKWLTEVAPELFAAACPYGIGYDLLEEELLPERTREKIRARGFRSVEIPFIIQYGIHEKPFGINWDDAEVDTEWHLNFEPDFAPPRGRTKEEKITPLIERLNASDCKKITVEDCVAVRDSLDEAIQVIGAPCDRTEVLDRYGVKTYVGDFYNTKGENWLRVATTQYGIHHPTVLSSELGWEYVSQFRRDENTGEIVSHQF